jgi:hypothetical protein
MYVQRIRKVIKYYVMFYYIIILSRLGETHDENKGF